MSGAQLWFLSFWSKCFSLQEKEQGVCTSDKVSNCSSLMAWCGCSLSWMLLAGWPSALFGDLDCFENIKVIALLKILKGIQKLAEASGIGLELSISCEWSEIFILNMMYFCIEHDVCLAAGSAVLDCIALSRLALSEGVRLPGHMRMRVCCCLAGRLLLCRARPP